MTILCINMENQNKTFQIFIIYYLETIPGFYKTTIFGYGVLGTSRKLETLCYIWDIWDIWNIWDSW